MGHVLIARDVCQANIALVVVALIQVPVWSVKHVLREKFEMGAVVYLAGHALIAISV